MGNVTGSSHVLPTTFDQYYSPCTALVHSLVLYISSTYRSILYGDGQNEEKVGLERNGITRPMPEHDLGRNGSFVSLGFSLSRGLGAELIKYLRCIHKLFLS